MYHAGVGGTSSTRHHLRLASEKLAATVRLAFSTAAFGESNLSRSPTVRYSCNSGPAVLYFDYSLTFGDEVERFWMRKFSPAAFGFFLNRYLSVLGHIPVMYEFFGPQVQSVSVLR